MITFPIYLQRYFIKIICLHIDYCNDLMDVEVLNDGSYEVYRENEYKIKELMLTIALVSKEWFKTLSNNLKIGVDFNYKEKGEDQFSIIKMENIETLKVHYNHQNNQFYKIFDFIPIIIPIETVNEQIMKLSTMEGTNFKYLKIKNLNHTDDITGIIDRIYQLKQTNNYSVVLWKLLLDEDVKLEQINKLKKKVWKIIALQIREPSSFEIILETFKQWSNNLDDLDVLFSRKPLSIINEISSYNSNDDYDDDSDYDSDYDDDDDGKGNIGTKINHLSNIKHCDLPPISITELYTLIKSAPKLKYLSFVFCLNSLLIHLKNEAYRIQQKQQFYIPYEGCRCIGFSNEEILRLNRYSRSKSINFTNYLSNIIEYLNENENTINHLRIYIYCASRSSSSIGKEIYETSTFLIEKLVSLISSFKNLKIFEPHFFNKQLFNQLAIKNPNITHYRIKTPSEKLISKKDLSIFVNNILKRNPHIVQFTLIEK
ncbi:hypothetical protein ACTA71_010219 [Dictyostelium dimigraforme]